VQQFLQGLDTAFSARMRSIAIGRFKDQQIATLGRVGVRQEGSIGAAEVTGENYPKILALLVGESEEDKAGAEDITELSSLPARTKLMPLRYMSGIEKLSQKDMASRNMGSNSALVAWVQMISPRKPAAISSGTLPM